MNKQQALRIMEWYLANGINCVMKGQGLHIENHVESKEVNLQTCKNLQELKQLMQFNEDCKLRLTATNMVFADGNQSAKIMIIGEAPGAEEDKEGLPFVGASGQLLGKILRSIGLNRENVYITNIIPYRPPGNRPPNASEIERYLPFVDKHIDLIKPKILILLGGVAAKALLNCKEGVMKIRGTWQDYTTASGFNVKAMATFHPSFLMRAPSNKAHAWVDMLKIKQELDELGA